jgi:hypothetical protein
MVWIGLVQQIKKQIEFRFRNWNEVTCVCMFNLVL